MLHKGKDSDEVDHFENPWKAFVKTLVMAQGEYQVIILEKFEKLIFNFIRKLKILNNIGMVGKQHYSFI